MPAGAASVQPSATRRWGVHALWAAVGAAAGIALWWALTGAPRSPAGTEALSLAVNAPSSIRIREVVTVTGGHDLIVSGFSKRPDGTDDPRPRLYLRRLGSFDFTEIPGTVGVQSYSRSPNAPWLAVVTPVSDQSADLRLVRLPVDGSSPPVTIANWDRDWSGLTWLRGDDLLILTAQGTKFIRLPSAGGSPSAATSFDFGGVTGYPILYSQSELPGGRGLFLSFATYGPQGYRQDVLVLDPATGKTTRIVENAAHPFYDPVSGRLFFSRSTTLLAIPFDPATLTAGRDPVALFEGLRANSWSHGAFEVAANGTLVFDPGGRQGGDRRLVTVDATRQPAPFVPEARGYEATVSMSADRQHVAAVIPNTRGTYETWVATSGRPGLRRTLALPGADCAGAVWSPDGEWLAFSRIARDKDDGVYVQRADGSGQPTVALLAGGIEHSLTLTGWLPDGSGVLVTRLLGVRRDVVLVRIARDGTASPPEPVRVSPNNTDGGWVSPDGRLVLFGAEDSGRPELYVAEFRDGKIAGQPVPVGTAGQYHEARWGADGKRYYVRQDESKIMTGTIERSPVLRASPPALAWDLDTLNLVPGLFDITPDGRLLGLQLGQGEKDRLSAGIVLNWLDAARVKLRR